LSVSAFQFWKYSTNFDDFYCSTVNIITIISFIPTHAHILHFKHHKFTLILKTLENILKNLPLHVSVHIYDHLQGANEQCFMQLLT